MNEINNKRLAKFEGKCWHECVREHVKHIDGKWYPDRDTTPASSKVFGYYCYDCKTELEYPLPRPSYSTSPADRERLWGYLGEQKDMRDEFCEWAWKKNSEERVWNKVPWFVHWLTHPLDGTPRWVSLLSKWLGMEEVREKWGISKCPHYPKECNGCYRGNANYEWCESCDGSGKIRAEWAKEE